MRKLQFLCAYTVPSLVILGWYLGGLWLLAVPIYVFGLVPLLDNLWGRAIDNPEASAYESLRKDLYYRLITWIFVPIQWALVLYSAWLISHSEIKPWEVVLFTLSLGISSGAVGITLAHELGHRSNRFEQLLAQTLLLSVSYTHFFIEHNLGHHRNVATAHDPATSRFGESLYRYLPRALRDSWLSAWQIEVKTLGRRGLGSFSLRNRMLWYAFLPTALVVLLVWVWGPAAGLFFLAQSAIAFLLLETINYVEHYGLLREVSEDGHIEKVQPHHSWNSSQRLTNALLFNLQRHSDHHASANRRYQTLRHFEDVPQLPTGYAGMVLLAFVPPLWFAVMNPKVQQFRHQLGAVT